MSLTLLRTVVDLLVERARVMREDDRGMTTETVIVIGALISLALGVTFVITQVVQGKADTISLD